MHPKQPGGPFLIAITSWTDDFGGIGNHDLKSAQPQESCSFARYLVENQAGW